MLGRDNEFSEAIRKIGNTIIPVFNRAILLLEQGVEKRRVEGSSLDSVKDKIKVDISHKRRSLLLYLGVGIGSLL